MEVAAAARVSVERGPVILAERGECRARTCRVRLSFAGVDDHAPLRGGEEIVPLRVVRLRYTLHASVLTGRARAAKPMR